MNTNLIPYDRIQHYELLESYLDKNRKYNSEIDPLHLRSYSPDWAESEAIKLQEEITLGDTRVLFIKYSEHIVGFLVIKKQNEKKKVQKLSKIYIDKEYRSKGIGAKSLELVETQIKKDGYQYLLLNVFYPNQIAYKFYIKNGYENRFVDMIKKL